MKKFDITESFLYRWRYQIGYSLVAIGLIISLLFIAFYLPGGISKAEMNSVIKSGAASVTNPDPLNIINLPYYLFQKLFLKIIGVSILSIKLPSIIIAFLSAIALVLLLRQWFKPNVSILASLIAITTGQFLFISQSGTPDVLYLFWPTILLLLATLASKYKKQRVWLYLLFCLAAALSLYTPLSAYVLLVFIVAALLHPHLRFFLKKLPKLQLILGLVIALIFISPLAWGFINNPKIIFTLLGLPEAWTNIGTNLSLLFTQYFSFANPGGTTSMTPFFELGSMLLIFIGIYRIIKTRATAKSLSVILWTICLIPIIILNPTLTGITYLPLIILLAAGLNELLSHWYGLFPNNPYARIAGLIPIIILVSALTFSGIGRYVYSYRYNPTIVSNFSYDLQLIPKNTKNIVVSNDELGFYSVVAKYNKKISVSTKPTSDTFVSTRSAKGVFDGYEINKIVTSTLSNNSDRFYIYKKITE